MKTQLAAIDQIQRALSKATNVLEVKELRDRATGLATYYRLQKGCKDVERQAVVIRLRAERRLGELLKKSVRPGNFKLSRNTTNRLPDGITRDQSSQWQQLAVIPTRAFEDLLASRGELSTRRAVQLAREHARRRYRAGGPESGGNIITGDMAVLSKKLEANSVAAFVSDPPYADTAAYAKLARLAKQKLRVGGVVVLRGPMVVQSGYRFRDRIE
jgi:hypothetical protein